MQRRVTSPGVSRAPSAGGRLGEADAAEDEGWPVAVGTTSLSVPLPGLDRLVAPWRRAWDTAARHGGTAHATVLFPFLPRERVDGAARAALAHVFAAHPPFELRFTGCARFPGVLWLRPEPDAPLRALTAAVTARWPGHRPYDGLFGDLDPHVTVANSGDARQHDLIEAALAPHLPLTERVSAVDLVAYDGNAWRQWLRLPLGRGDGGPAGHSSTNC
ncbi:2'-5' RNA ligase family protein [Streptomyces fragilis]|uniref:2'-5' RNA ligase family protein n=1 Tax=Streptomyces fragilis TaxID=67301 RepID=A0ABV2YRD5_9ACTN|nr:2'-5' RNA ligase family protein [Streptomyces fragilis]